jgi:predicted phosphoribosyltransferase
MPADGVPAAAIVAEHIHLYLDVLVVSKITLPFAKLLIGSKAFEVRGHFQTPENNL